MVQKSTTIAPMIQEQFKAIAVIVTLIIAVRLGQAEQWSRFRGPNGTGVADTLKLPQNLKDSVSWRLKLAGVGHSSPILWDSRLYVQSAEDHQKKQILFCIDASSGRELWRQLFDFDAYRIHQRNSFGSATPAADESGVFVAMGTPDNVTLVKFDHDGRKVWQQDVGGFQCNHGPAVSLMVVNGFVICPMLEEPPRNDDAKRTIRARILACDAADGQKKWEVTRDLGKASFCVPCVYKQGATQQLIFCSEADGMFALDPATGEEQWSMPVFRLRTVSSPIVAGDLLIGTNGSGGGGNYLVAIAPAPSPREVYRVRKQAPYVPTPVYHNGLLFLWSDRGVATCIAAENGEELWRHRLGDSTSASPICVGSQFVGVTDAGEVYVFDATRELNLANRYSLGATTRATPAAGNGHVYFRTENEIIAIRCRE